MAPLGQERATEEDNDEGRKEEAAAPMEQTRQQEQQPQEEQPKAELPPSHQWGLDPLFWTYIRALACHLVPPYLEYIEGFDFGPFFYGPRRRPVCKVMMVGTIVAVRQQKRQVAFWLDDGTGLMQCTFWPPDLDVFARDDFLYGGGGEGGREGGRVVAHVMEKVGTGTAGFRRTRDSGVDDGAFEAIQVGRLVLVLGDLQYYRGITFLNVKGDVREAEGPHEEITHWLHAIRLNDHIYSQPFQRNLYDVSPFSSFSLPTTRTAAKAARGGEGGREGGGEGGCPCPIPPCVPRIPSSSSSSSFPSTSSSPSTSATASSSSSSSFSSVAAAAAAPPPPPPPPAAVATTSSSNDECPVCSEDRLVWLDLNYCCCRSSPLPLDPSHTFRRALLRWMYHARPPSFPPSPAFPTVTYSVLKEALTPTALAVLGEGGKEGGRREWTTREKVSTMCQLTLQGLRGDGVVWYDPREGGREVVLLSNPFLGQQLQAWWDGGGGGGRRGLEGEELLAALREDREGVFYHVPASRLLSCVAGTRRAGGEKAVELQRGDRGGGGGGGGG